MFTVREVLTAVGQAIVALLMLGVLWFWFAVIYALMHTPEPEERCFRAATSAMGYCRTQQTWEVK